MPQTEANEPPNPSSDKPVFAGAFLPMFRVLSLSMLVLVSIAIPAIAGPELGDDIAICRDKENPDKKARQDACERLITDNKATGKDLALAYAVRANALSEKRNYVKSIEAYNQAIELDPDNFLFLNGRGWVYERTGKDDQAVADYNLALQKRTNFAPAYANRGYIYMRKAAFQSALDDFNEAIRIKPDMYFAHTNRGRVELVNRDYDAALADFDEAEKINPNPPQAAVFRCMAYTEMGKFDDALKNCNAVLAKVPNYLFGLCTRAEVYIAKGNLDAALQDINTVLRINPNHLRAHADRGRIYEKRGDLAQARADYRSAAFTLLPYDELDNAIARKTAQERLEALATQGPATATGRRSALVIGNGAYRNVHPLDNPPRDAKLIAGSLRDLGFQSVTLANDLTRDKFFEVLRTFASEAENADWAVIYYAGHGFEIGGVNYLVPIDAKLAVDTDAEKEAVALEQVIATVGGARKLRLLMLDACRDNPFAATMQHTIALKLVDKGFSDIEPSAGFMVVYAAKHGETALDGVGADSPFATAVAKDIREPHVEVRKLFDIVRDDVWAATKHVQQPFTYGSPPGREDFYFVTEAPQSDKESPPAPPRKGGRS
jgi:tetratricopeptide (TPR) repeat protein